MNKDIRFLIVAFDGLRPDMVDDALMPNLSAFFRSGSHCTDNRAVFPTETRVNQSSLITGCHPGRHGMVANKFMEPAAGGFLNTADFDALSTADDALNGILTAPSLGEILHDAEHPSRLILPMVEPGTTEPEQWIADPAAYFSGLDETWSGF